MKEGKLDDFIYSTTQNETFPYRVADKLYIRKLYPEMIYTAINESELGKREYVYSDLGYYYLKKVAEKYTSQSLDVYVKSTFYRKLGMSNTTYHPRDYFSLDKLVPTEYDMAFRKQLVQGDVHDPGAAMMGGVGGHAGLFSNANDLAKLMQMYMQMGRQVFQVRVFTNPMTYLLKHIFRHQVGLIYKSILNIFTFVLFSIGSA